MIKFIHSTFKFCIQHLVVKQHYCVSITVNVFLVKCISQRHSRKQEGMKARTNNKLNPHV